MTNVFCTGGVLNSQVHLAPSLYGSCSLTTPASTSRVAHALFVATTLL